MEGPAGPQPAVARSQLLRGTLLAATAAAAAATLPSLSSAAATSTGEAETLSSVTAAAVTAAGRTAAGEQLSKVVLRTLRDCQLAVSVYPTFDYNAAGGGGQGTVATQGDLLHVTFDPASLQIPPIKYSTTAILGIPIPPPLEIAIRPRKLEGTVNPATGEAELEFLADFAFTAAPLYTAAPLVVATTLTTEASEGAFRKGQGQRLGGDGRARLVGVARVPRTEDGFLNSFLMLPTDALAVLSAEIEFS
ncbi:hypothetical protein N2152v2_007522 [Parachlorella kessleri]